MLQANLQPQATFANKQLCVAVTKTARHQNPCDYLSAHHTVQGTFHGPVHSPFLIIRVTYAHLSNISKKLQENTLFLIYTERFSFSFSSMVSIRRGWCVGEAGHAGGRCGRARVRRSGRARREQGNVVKQCGRARRKRAGFRTPATSTSTKQQHQRSTAAPTHFQVPHSKNPEPYSS